LFPPASIRPALEPRGHLEGLHADVEPSTSFYVPIKQLEQFQSLFSSIYCPSGHVD